MFSAQQFKEKLLRELLNRPNFSIKMNSEVSDLTVGNMQTGLASGVTLSNKFGSIPCDAVVFCTGS